ncbi:C40 family peptidase [Fictibacillus sp. KIGAM418]|uniref:C40 family peptidase n=1 Tax=Fictibacillus marinisediminis TaxID=2878389 RepID=A0A9X1X9C4_9BACL|nr:MULTISPECIES: C40 family peptidase [Fictibacillus]MCK6255976.1 C40 family peptidase [Fictibacillus marinisediminis]MED2973967.1 C40 family peptidase [Fictibacillus sp. B-59209]SFE18055.1 Cell wall-associated hydrolase, NlpC family [Bacillus sp. OV194]
MKKLVAAAALLGMMAFNPIVGKAALGDHTLKQGMTSKDVQQLQTVLKKKGYFTYKKTTTYYGTYTKSAVKKFQKAKKLKADGVAGKSTFKALGVKTAVKSTSYSSSGLISTAKRYMGVPYRWGGTTPKGFDCSGYINYVFDKSAGIDLPRTVSGIYLKGTSVSTPKAGDVVFFQTYKHGASHAGIYIGDHKFIHSSSSKGVSIASMQNPYWAPKFLGAKKI